MSYFGRVQTRLPCLERAPHTTSDYWSFVMQSYNTRPNPNTKFGSNQSEAKKETHAQAECLQGRERERDLDPIV
jgi:hypothetical protein